MMTVKINKLTITTLLIAASGIALGWNSLVNLQNNSPKNQSTHSATSITASYTHLQQTSPANSTESGSDDLHNEVAQPMAKVPADLLQELMAAMIEQGLANGTYTVETLPLELRPFVRLNPNSSREVYEAVEEITAQEEERIAAIEAMFADDYVPPEPEFKCPDPEDPGPQWQGSHGRMILEEKGCTVY